MSETKYPNRIYCEICKRTIFFYEHKLHIGEEIASIFAIYPDGTKPKAGDQIADCMESHIHSWKQSL